MNDQSLKQFVALVEETPVLGAVYDGTDHLRYANAAFRSTFAVAADEMPFWDEIMRRNLRSGVGTVIKSADFESWLISTKSRRGKLPYRAFEMDLQDGRWFLMTETVNADGWMLCIATDITPLKTGRRELRQARDFALRASQTDELTGISSRRAMMGALEMLNEAVTEGRVAAGCLCILDLDLFKNVNDTFGHQIGDQVLVEFARLTQTATRRRDHFGRIGGEEFMLIFPDTSLEEATRVVERVLHIVRQARPIPVAPAFSCTCSAGIAAAIPGQTTGSLYARADLALYRAKHAGRDRLELAV
ncbi:sensor domain-containing diguanylate cyclase [Acidisoma silvae]|uniref:diguanylate cyclase n=1 Tax=Acidisoma silvae TaxID=2802396 RepID=A0A963YQH3_9PROT|nr:GGDEF domain-containing protein [Acidisoma silvae]MCB8875077.1 GGDEF domain-containing protein [Acidisoma silvae]